MSHTSSRPSLQKEKPDEITGLVLSMQDYKENDGLLKVALPNEIVTFYCKGVLKGTSKNRRLCNPFSKVRLIYEPKYSRDMYYLIHGSVEWFDSSIQDDLDAQAVCFVLRDFILRIGITPAIYKSLEQCWHCFHDRDQDAAMMYACLTLASLLKLAGTAPNVENCAICGSRNRIASMVISEGGFVCLNCRKPEWAKASKEKLKAWRALFRAGFEHADYLLANFLYTIEDFLFMADFYAWHTQYNPASVRFLYSVLKLNRKVQPSSPAVSQSSANHHQTSQASITA